MDKLIFFIHASQQVDETRRRRWDIDWIWHARRRFVRITRLAAEHRQPKQSVSSPSEPRNLRSLELCSSALWDEMRRDAISGNWSFAAAVIAFVFDAVKQEFSKLDHIILWCSFHEVHSWHESDWFLVANIMDSGVLIARRIWGLFTVESKQMG